MIPQYIIVYVTLSIAILALVVGVVALSVKRTVVQKEIVFEDDSVKLKDGIVFAKGFSNEPYKTNKEATMITDKLIQAFKFSDGMSQMSEGNVDVAQQISCRRFSDGTLHIENGSLTTSASITADNILVTRSLDAPAEYFANMYALQMQEVHFSKQREWKDVATNTNAAQFFFPGVDKSLHHGVTISKHNKIKLQKKGKWRYEFTFLILGKGFCCVGANFDHSTPKLTNGYGSGTDRVYVNGFGIVDVVDVETPYKFYFQHIDDPSSGEYGLQLEEGHIMLQYIGR